MATLYVRLELVLVLLGLFPFAYSAPPPPPPLPPPPPSGPPPGYDYFIFALQWPNAFCKQASGKCNPKVPTQSFTVHGLWPQKNAGSSPEFCPATEELTDAILKNHEKDLLKYWPQLYNANDFTKSRSFWKYQWRKHGTCSSNNFKPEAYLTAAINLAKAHAAGILDEMKKAGIKFDGKTTYTKFRVLSTIEKATVTTSSSGTKGVEAKLYVKNDDLFEIYLCVNADGKTLQDCNDLNPYIKFASAPTLTQLPYNLESTSLHEFEEADEFWL